MARYTLERLGQLIIVAALASVVVFMLLRMVPGDPVTMYLGPDATAEQVEAVRRAWGLDEPYHVQYWQWIVNVVQGDLGVSRTSGVPVATLIGSALPPTIELAIAAFVLAVLMGVTTGVIAAMRPRSAVDAVIGFINAVLLGTPAFWIGIVLILIFTLWLGWLPAGGRVPISEDFWGGLRSLILPAISLCLLQMSIISRYLRSSLLGTMSQDYIRTATAKGLSRVRVVLRHALRNAMIPVVTIMGLRLGALLGGAVVIEVVFAWPGVGRLLINSVGIRDYLVVQSLILVLVAIFLTTSFLVDISYGWIDPRVRQLAGASER